MTRRMKLLCGILPAVLVGASCDKSTSGSGTEKTIAPVAASTTAGVSAANTPATSPPTPAPGPVASDAVVPDSHAPGADTAPAAPATSADSGSLDRNAATAAPAVVATAGGSAGASAAAVGGPATAPAVVATANSPEAAAIDPEVARKKAKIEWALKQEEIKNDPNGQWAVDAKASSTRGNAQGNAAYAPGQATGLPNIESLGNNSLAWTPATPDAGIEWLELQYAKPVHATLVRIRESYGAGAIIKVELFDEQGGAHTVWTGVDATKDLEYLVVPFARTAFKTARIRLTLATNIVPGLNEIDAVQLVGSEK